jgi:RNA polymerase sigma factor (sigma-70 family)
MLKADFPDLTRQQFAEAIVRVHAVLTSRQRWQINVRNKRRKHIDDSGLSLLPVDTSQLSDQNQDPEGLAQSQQERRLLQSALLKLSPDERLILMLRYTDGLTLKKIAEITRLGDPFRVRRQIKTTLNRLSGILSKASLEKLRKN